jgi:hypothetical protein
VYCREAIDYMVGLSKEREMRRLAKCCKLILARAAVADITKALSLALFLDAKLDVSAKTVRTRKAK